MLSDKEAIATVAVKDLKAAAAFYEGSSASRCTPAKATR